MKKMLVLLTLVVIVLFCVSSADAKWVKLEGLYTDEVSALYYDDATVSIHTAEGLIQADILGTMTDFGKKRFVEDTLSYVKPSLREEARAVASKATHQQWTFEWRYRQNENRILYVIVYGNKEVLSKGPVDDVFVPLRPDSNGAAILNILKKTYGLR